MKDPRDIILLPKVTEKGVNLRNEQNQYVFKVAKEANKIEIKRAVETLFKVKVTKVRVINVKPKPKRLRSRFYGRTSSWKKAYVSLKEGDRIPIFEAG